MHPDSDVEAARPPRATEYHYGRMQRLARLEQKHGMQRRFVAAIFGGLSVTAPMLVMAIHQSEVKTLITASVAVVVFALIVAWKSSAQAETFFCNDGSLCCGFGGICWGQWQLDRMFRVTLVDLTIWKILDEAGRRSGENHL